MEFLNDQKRTAEDKLRMICLGNVGAYSFCSAFLDFTGVLDDMFDKDHNVTTEQLCRSYLAFFQNIAFNEFFIQNKNSIFPLLVQGCNAWSDSELLSKSESQRLKDSADVLKCFYGEILYHVAFICGGYDHMRKCASEYRGFDFEN